MMKNENNISFDINPLRFEIAYNKSLEIFNRYK